MVAVAGLVFFIQAELAGVGGKPGVKTEYQI
jgi:hypothetical protein